VTLCLVTDRRRRPAGDQLRAAVAAGIDLLQIRERDLESSALARLVHESVELANGTASRIVVNDRLDVALAAGAHGVHLRHDSIPAGRARSMTARGFLIGQSVHDVGEAKFAARHADYLIAGTVFPTGSKPSHQRLLGLAGLASIVEAAGVPVLAIGGITPERIKDVRSTGASGIAAISLFAAEPSDLAGIVARLRRSWENL
jgi:thiamine-phosphate pyrophosphorylase